MFGAILGDIIGSPYEFDMGNKTKDFPFFDKGCEFTDDTVMTIAVAEALMDVDPDADDETVKSRIIEALKYWGKKYPDAGYGVRFSMWLRLHNTEAYNSCGNGSAMRVSAAGWMGRTLEEARRLACLSAKVTHNHPEGIKGSEAVASAIFMARRGCDKAQIKAYIIDEFGYDLSRTCDDIRPGYYHTELCQQTVPEALTAFLEGEDFEDVIRTAVSLGGDCDTLTAIAGSIAEAYYGVPVELKLECYKRLDNDLCKVLSDFEQRFHFNEEVMNKYHPFYWFDKDDGGFVQLKRPAEEPLTMTESHEAFETSTQAMDGWRRANLYRNVFGVWDATMFGAWMSTPLGYGPFVDEDGEEYTLVFATPQAADRCVYPFLEEKQVAQLRANVEAFYADPAEQMRWPFLVLHPVALKITKSGELVPVTMQELDPGKINFAEHMVVELGERI